jgi:hypothetical protein
MTTTYRASADHIPVIDKSQNALLDYPFDWAGKGWLQAGETIASSTITVATGITNTLTTVLPGSVTAWLSGGVVGQTYLVTCNVLTSTGRRDERSIRLNIIQR